jgi:hypothetical protein
MSLTAPVALRDSRLRPSDLRGKVLEMVSRALTALVPFLSQGPEPRTDRTSNRLLPAHFSPAGFRVDDHA